MNEDEIFDLLKSKDAPWRIYPNPMRNDGVFLAQDRPLKPYPGIFDGDGRPVYPPTPLDAYAYERQLPIDMAERLVKRLNSEETRNYDEIPQDI